MFEGEARTDMRYVCPEGHKADARVTGQVSLLEEVDSKARVRRIEGGYLAGLWPGCERKRRKNGRNSIDMLGGNYFWKEAGCRRDTSTLVGRMKLNAKPVTRRKAQNGTKLDGKVLSESGSKKREPQRRVEKAKRHRNASTQ